MMIDVRLVVDKFFEVTKLELIYDVVNVVARVAGTTHELQPPTDALVSSAITSRLIATLPLACGNLVECTTART
jgi:hypothetical protein